MRENNGNSLVHAIIESIGAIKIERRQLWFLEFVLCTRPQARYLHI